MPYRCEVLRGVLTQMKTTQVMEGCELRLELESAQREHSSALTSVRAAADARVAAKDRELVSLQSELSSRRLLQQAAEDRTADLQKQVAALQQRLDDSHSAAQRAEAQSEGFRKEREAWAHEREELHRGLEAAQAASSEHLQKLLARDEHDRVLTQQLQLLELEVQRQRDATAHAQHEHQSKAEEVLDSFSTCFPYSCKHQNLSHMDCLHTIRCNDQICKRPNICLKEWVAFLR